MRSLREWRIWLGYKILPGTTELAVSLTRQDLLFELRRDIDEEKEELPDAAQRTFSSRKERLFDSIARNIPIRDEWDNADAVDANGIMSNSVSDTVSAGTLFYKWFLIGLTIAVIVIGVPPVLAAIL